MTAHEFGRGALVARADAAHQILVRIPHGWDANSDRRPARPLGRRQSMKALLLSTLCILTRRLPSDYLLFCGARLSAPRSIPVPASNGGLARFRREGPKFPRTYPFN